MKRHPRRSDEEWLNIIHECRTSGLPDKIWCEEHHIQPSKFYYHIRRLRAKACEIKERKDTLPQKQEVVPVSFAEQEFCIPPTQTTGGEGIHPDTVITIRMNLNIYQYLYTLLLYMPDYKNEPAGIKQLMPWSKFIKENCSGITDTEKILSENRGDLPI